jgi:hypothetical protein
MINTLRGPVEMRKVVGLEAVFLVWLSGREVYHKKKTLKTSNFVTLRC